MTGHLAEVAGRAAEVTDEQELAKLRHWYRTLARKIEANEMHVIPKPISTDDLEKLLIDYGLGG